MAFRFEKASGWTFRSGQYLDMTLLDPSSKAIVCMDVNNRSVTDPMFRAVEVAFVTRRGQMTLGDQSFSLEIGAE
jgi:hypothetical protein